MSRGWSPVRYCRFTRVVVVHGTDRLTASGGRAVEEVGVPRVPRVFTGAIRPCELRTTDAMQTLTEALLVV